VPRVLNSVPWQAHVNGACLTFARRVLNAYSDSAINIGGAGE
jgi:hypothetical protein